MAHGVPVKCYLPGIRVWRSGFETDGTKLSNIYYLGDNGQELRLPVPDC